ncbi:MAG: ACT domain-containing protein [Promethearchaeota archaeon]|nr:MAG: ACT domain-containing protein [Candidatus Lokiarchaeota archaeon]
MLKQISVFLPNQPGILANFTKVLMDEKINMRAISVAETADYGILRILVDKVDDCVKVLRENNYLVSTTDVIAVDIPDKPGALYEITKLLGDNNINIEYLYSTLVKEEAIIILRIDNLNKAVEVLKNKGVRLIEKQEF